MISPQIWSQLSPGRRLGSHGPEAFSPILLPTSLRLSRRMSHCHTPGVPAPAHTSVLTQSHAKDFAPLLASGLSPAAHPGPVPTHTSVLTPGIRLRPRPATRLKSDLSDSALSSDPAVGPGFTSLFAPTRNPAYF